MVKLFDWFDNMCVCNLKTCRIRFRSICNVYYCKLEKIKRETVGRK
jgi:hypothetical protein